MRTLGNYLLKTRIHSVLTMSALTALSVFVSPLSYFISGAPMGLVALRKGPVIGGQVALGSLLFIALIAMAMKIQAVIPAAFLFFVWLPVIICASVLRATQSQGLSVLWAGILGMVFTAYVHAILPHVREAWQAWFDVGKKIAAADLTAQQLEQLGEIVETYISTFMISGFVVSLITTLLLARWWQSVLFNPGGFRNEFHALRLPRSLVFPTLLGILLMLFTNNNAPLALRDVLIVALILYLYQGLATIHRYIHAKGRSRVWLIIMYVSFFLSPRVVLLIVAGAGITNACLGKAPEQSTNNHA